MYSAEKARKDAQESTFDPMSEWCFLDTWEFKGIEKKIKRAAARGQKEIKLRAIGDLSKLKLEQNGYKGIQFLRIPGTSIKSWVGVYWE